VYDEVPPEAHQEENYGYDTGSNSAVPDERDIITKDQEVDGYCENKQLNGASYPGVEDSNLEGDQKDNSSFVLVGIVLPGKSSEGNGLTLNR